MHVSNFVRVFFLTKDMVQEDNLKKTECQIDGICMTTCDYPRSSKNTIYPLKFCVSRYMVKSHVHSRLPGSRLEFESGSKSVSDTVLPRGGGQIGGRQGRQRSS